MKNTSLPNAHIQANGSITEPYTQNHLLSTIANVRMVTNESSKISLLFHHSNILLPTVSIFGPSWTPGKDHGCGMWEHSTLIGTTDGLPL